jgi:hypothetical protein
LGSDIKSYGVSNLPNRLLSKNTAIASLIATLIAAPFFLVSRRNKKMEDLYIIAIGQRSFSSVKSQAAVKELAKFSGKQATKYLLQIANSQTSAILGSQKTAISALATRDDPSIADRLSSQLQLYESLDARMEIAKTLAKLPCEFECIHSILYYKERRWRGEPTIQEQFVDPNFEEGNANLEKEEQDISQLLDGVLVREQRQTIQVLVNIYGLGTLNPSVFALTLTQQLGLEQSCPLLTSSFKEMKKFPEVYYKGPTLKTSLALQALKCSGSDRQN